MAADEEASILLLLRGEAAVQAGMERTALSVRGLAAAITEQNAAMAGQGRRSFLMNQALFTTRRLLYGGTLAMIGFTGVALKMGLTFNMQMENNRVALTQFLGSADAANTELTKLYDVAARTPFEFSNIVDATRRFLAFGFSLQQTNRYLNIIGDTAAAFGGGAEQIQRMVLVFGQMRAAGRVLGQDLLQLEQIGIPALSILQEQLGLTQEQMANIGRLHIPAELAIEALMRGLDQRFHGLSEKQAKTLQGRLSTLHDYAARLFGTLTLPLYERIRDKILPELSDLANQMQQAAKQGGIRGALRVVDTRYGTNLTDLFMSVGSAATSVWIIFKDDLVPILFIFYQMLPSITSILKTLAAVMAFFAHHATLTKIILVVLVAEFIRFRTVLLLFGSGGKGSRGGLLGMLATGLTTVGKRGMAWKNIFAVASFGVKANIRAVRQGWMALTKGMVEGSNHQIVKVGLLAKSILYMRKAFSFARLAIIEYTVAMYEAVSAQIVFLLTNPVGWIILLTAALIILIAGLVILYYKWDRFHKLVDRFAKFLYTHWALLAFIPILGPMIMLMVVVVKYWGRWGDLIRDIVHVFQVLWNLMKRFWNWTKHHTIGWLGKGLSFAFHHQNIPGAQHGGTVTSPGLVRVGEGGPEILSLPAGAGITPINTVTNFPVQSLTQRGGAAERPIEVKVYLDGKQIAASNARHAGNAKARA